jgi:hypothetical protein
LSVVVSITCIVPISVPAAEIAYATLEPSRETP